MKNIQINHDSPVPLYYQLREQMKENILSRKWEYGKELPAELQLCETLGLSRATVKQAMDGLVQQGLIERKKGKGTYVTYQSADYNFFSDPSLYRQIRDSGSEPYFRVISAEVGYLNADIGGYFDEYDGQFYKLKRVCYVNNRPIAIDEHYIHERLAPDFLKQNLNKLSVYDYLEEKNQFKFDSYHTCVQPVLLTVEDKQLLGIEDERVQLIIFKKDVVGMRLDITSYYNGEKMMFNRRRFNGNHYRISVNYSHATRQFSVDSSQIVSLAGE